MDILEKKYQDSLDLEGENLRKWYTSTQTEIPQEIITKHDNMKDYILL